MFGTILVSACTLMHIYVFWRAASAPFVDRHIPRGLLVALCVVLWATFLVGRVVGHRNTGALARTVELLAMNWMAVLFLACVCLLAIDIVTGFGFVLPRLAPSLPASPIASPPIEDVFPYVHVCDMVLTCPHFPTCWILATRTLLKLSETHDPGKRPERSSLKHIARF
jgi:hypothetical protein